MNGVNWPVCILNKTCRLTCALVKHFFKYISPFNFSITKSDRREKRKEEEKKNNRKKKRVKTGYCQGDL